MSKAVLAVGRVIRWSFVGPVPVGCEQLGKPPTSTPRLHARGHLRTGKLDLVDVPDRAAGEVTPGPVRVDIASPDYRAAITVAKC